MDISVIICAYTEKRWDDLLAAVDSIKKQTLPPREIILVIDYNQTLLERVKAQLSDVVIIENAQQKGLSGARNSGIAKAQGAIIAFMDEDAVAAPNWLETIAAGYENDHTLGVGGAIDPIWIEGRPGWFPDEFNWVVGCTYRGMPESTTEIRNMLGCNMSFRRDVFPVVGDFRHGIGRVDTRPVGCEETELCIRVNQEWPDHQMLYIPDARVSHRVPGIRANWSYFLRRCYSEGLSKAQVARFVGAKDGLASERTYTFRTLPQGVWRGLTDAVLRKDAAGLGRASAIVVGLGFTTVGYLVGTVSERIAMMKER